MATNPKQQTGESNSASRIMREWECKCGQEVLDAQHPEPIKWSDGHVCHFTEKHREVDVAIGMDMQLHRVPRNAEVYKQTIKTLVELVDQLRQPYNNGPRHDLYLLATKTLNELEVRGAI